jgi:hypothetical protein
MLNMNKNNTLSFEDQLQQAQNYSLPNHLF